MSNNHDVSKEVRLTEHLLTLFGKIENSDALFKQFIPDENENKISDINKDPFDEQNSMIIPGVIKRYSNRVILIVTNECFVYCRYCTRRWQWGKKITLNYDEIFNYLRNNNTINEVIISGGDPLTLGDEQIDYILRNLFSINNIKIVRIGTRVLTFDPDRINENLLSVLSGYKPVYLMTHFNSIDEFNDLTIEKIHSLNSAGISICNQSVLLKGVNDSVQDLKKLFEKLVLLQIRPYYLFSCDPIATSSLFKVSIENGLKIYNQLRKETGGLSIPFYIEDTKEFGKVILS